LNVIRIQVVGIEGLHAAGIVHCDLKPQNILIRSDGHIVLTDFGLCKAFPPPTSSNLKTPPPPSGQGLPPWMSESLSQWTTDSGVGDSGDGTYTFYRTAEYLAPEIIQGLPYSYEVDWWSFGILLYEMLSGIVSCLNLEWKCPGNPDMLIWKTPFWANSHSDICIRVLQDELQFPKGKAMDQDTRSLICRVRDSRTGKLLSYLCSVYIAPGAKPNFTYLGANQETSVFLHDVGEDTNIDFIHLLIFVFSAIGDLCIISIISVCPLGNRLFSSSCWLKWYFAAPYIPPIAPLTATNTQNYNGVLFDVDQRPDATHNPVTDSQRKRNKDGRTVDPSSVTASARSTAGPKSREDATDVHIAQEDEPDIFDGYSFDGRTSVIIESEDVFEGNAGQGVVGASAAWSEAVDEDLVCYLGARERTRQEILWEIVASEDR
jgi:serine/threonine protein kinase